MSDRASVYTPWEFVIVRSWQKIAVTFTAALSLASLVWHLMHPDLTDGFFFAPHVISQAQLEARHALLPIVGGAALIALMLSLRILVQTRRGRSDWRVHRELLLTSLLGFPLLLVPGVEFDHALVTGAVVLVMSLAVAWAVRNEVESRRALPDLTDRQAWFVVCSAFLVFVGVIGFISHWRFITFHAEVNDTTWEVGAIAGILRHGVPTVSVAAWLYDGQPLPAPYFNNHVPFADYLFVPFYALYPDARTVLWLQAAFMGCGAFGAHLIGRRWLGSQFGGAFLALLYVLNPSVQSLCLHDVHANIIAIPALLLAIGFMENGRFKTALGFALLTAICREETPVYAASIGVFWMFSGEDRRRFRIGLAVLVVSILLQAFFVGFLMPHFGGQSNLNHFNLLFDGKRSPVSMLAALVFNPLGAALSSTSPIKLDYLAISFLPLGAVALWGWRAGWFLLPALLLLVPAGTPTFFAIGINYSAPLVPGAVLTGMAGLAALWKRPTADVFRRRTTIAAYVISTALFCNYLYGNIASKTYKFEFGQSPYRRQSQLNYQDIVGYVDRLPPYGPAQKALWEVIERVPKDAAVLTSWAINPQFADHDISLVFKYSRGNPPPETRVDFIVIDKLPPMQAATEPEIIRLRADKGWVVFYENESGVIFAPSESRRARK